MLGSQDVDRTLKFACEGLIRICVDSSTLPLTKFLDKSTTYLSSRPGGSAELSSQAFATPEQVMDVHRTFKDELNGKVTEWKERLLLYLQDEDTVNVLIPPAQVSLLLGMSEGQC